MYSHFSITNESKGNLSTGGLPFEAIKNAVLGKKYDLSVTFVSRSKIRTLNKTYRNRNEATDILSFPLSKNEGEIFINLEETKKIAKDFNRSYENFLAYLFIHGLVHLKGHDHGNKMEKEEVKYRKKFGV